MIQKILYSTIFSLSLFFAFADNTIAQQLFPENGFLFDDTSVARVDISIDPDSLDIIINGDPYSDHEFPAIFKFTRGTDSFTVDSIGFRLRGNTSRVSDKKSFKVSLNSFIPGQKFYGVEKINLNGEHNDPSITRSKIVWDLFRKAGVPATRSSHTELYINDIYKGLYINVEHVDEEFLNLRFGNNDGNLYKCTWPADLNYISNNPDDYKFSHDGRRAYELKRNEEIDDYSDLAHFIDIINNKWASDFPRDLEPIFNINSFLKNYAIEVLTGHWDAYAFNKNNYYLYKNEETGKFEFIPYDADNTLGIDWFGIDWATRDIYNWSSPWEERPLVEMILDNDLYRDRYSFYMNRFIDKFFNPDSLNNYVYSIKNQLAPFVIDDTFRTKDYGFTYNDFINSYDIAIKDHVKDGITNYISTRTSTALNQLEQVNISPIISRVRDNNPNLNESIVISALIEDESNPVDVKLFYRSVEDFTEISMSESAPSSENYTATINSVQTDTRFEYFLEARDDQNQLSRDPVIGYYELKIGDIFDGISPDKSLTKFRVFPNPFQDNIYLQSDGDMAEVSYTLYDIRGKELKTGFIDVGMSINLGNTVNEKGVYILRINYSGNSGQKYEENLKLIFSGE